MSRFTSDHAERRLASTHGICRDTHPPPQAATWDTQATYGICEHPHIDTRDMHALRVRARGLTPDTLHHHHHHPPNDTHTLPAEAPPPPSQVPGMTDWRYPSLASESLHCPSSVQGGVALARACSRRRPFRVTPESLPSHPRVSQTLRSFSASHVAPPPLSPLNSRRPPPAPPPRPAPPPPPPPPLRPTRRGASPPAATPLPPPNVTASLDFVPSGCRPARGGGPQRALNSASAAYAYAYAAQAA